MIGSDAAGKSPSGPLPAWSDRPDRRRRAPTCGARTCPGGEERAEERLQPRLDLPALRPDGLAGDEPDDDARSRRRARRPRRPQCPASATEPVSPAITPAATSPPDDRARSKIREEPPQHAPPSAGPRARRRVNESSIRRPASAIRAARRVRRSSFRSVGEGDGDRARVAHEHDEALAARDRRVEEVARQHDEVRGEQRDDHGGVLAPLRLVHAACVRQRQLVERAALVRRRLGRRRNGRRACRSSGSMLATTPTSPFQTLRS